MSFGHALALRALSVQAHTLGHYRQAIHLADTAFQCAKNVVPPQTKAFLRGQLAVARATAGDRREALTHLKRTERELESADLVSRPVGAYHSGSLAHQCAAVAVRFGEHRAAAMALEAATQHRPSTERRSRPIVLARLAELQAAVGQFEPACQTWTHFLGDYPYLQSARVDAALANLRALTRPHQHNPSVRQLRDMVGTMPRRQDPLRSAVTLRLPNLHP